jgi:hypothetical protein
VAPYLKGGTGEQRAGSRKAQPHASGSTLPARRSKLVVLESTTYPGTTDEDLTLGVHARLIIDTRNAMADRKTKPGQVWKA